MSGFFRCRSQLFFARFVGRTGTAVVLGGLFLNSAVSRPEAAAREREGGEAEAVACACVSTGEVSVGRGGDPSDSASELDSFVPPKVTKVERPRHGLRVLVLGDSLALCGFGKALDSRLRKLPQVESVSTYMACGSVPTTWLMSGPLANARTTCGFWSIEGDRGQTVKEVRDTFGMEKGRRPGTYTVPKLEHLAEVLQPDILVMQNGTNLLSLFSDGKTILPARHGSQIRSYMSPFVLQLAQRGHSLKKVYWVAPPVTERVSKEVQDFLFKRMDAYASPLIEFIDSRTLVSHPYKNPMADKEHFIGKDMDVWADKVFKRVQDDILNDGYANRSVQAGGAPASVPDPELAVVGLPAGRARLSVRVRLLAKSRPLPLEKITPYQESMVGFLYRVEQVFGGAYPEKELLVMHPAHIAQKPEPLEKYTVGEVYSMDLIEFEGSPWEAIKRSEQTGRMELLPFIRKEDEARFPSGGR